MNIDMCTKLCIKNVIKIKKGVMFLFLTSIFNMLFSVNFALRVKVSFFSRSKYKEFIWNVIDLCTFPTLILKLNISVCEWFCLTPIPQFVSHLMARTSWDDDEVRFALDQHIEFQTKDYTIGMCCFSAKHAALMRKSKDWLVRNQDNVSEWSNMSTRGVLFQWASTINIQLNVVSRPFLKKKNFVDVLMFF
jgi:hypothetical protein